jgi:tetratricopeptide (TPR) repeat protein
MKYIPIVLACLILTGLLYTQKEELSSGKRYYDSLQKWYQLASIGDWTSADKIALKLDPPDIALYRQHNHPEELKKIINSLVVAPKKSVEDWLELARVQSILGKKDDAFTSLSKAYELDPIRDDITSLYYKTKK